MVDIPNRSADSGIPRVIIAPAEGTSATKVTHEFTDKTTWYEGSVEVIAGSCTLDTGFVYDMGQTKIIDTENAKLYDEDNLDTKYRVAVYENGSAATTGYSINYNTGKITFDSAPTTPITADFYYADKSTWTLIPDAGKYIDIQNVELQFTNDIQLNSPITFEIWVYNPYDLPNKVVYQSIKYKTLKDVIASCNLGKGVISQFGDLPGDVYVFPWNYLTVKRLKSSQGAELRISVDSDVELTGSWANASFYILCGDE